LPLKILRVFEELKRTVLLLYEQFACTLHCSIFAFFLNEVFYIECEEKARTMYHATANYDI
jgi:hypothetical protein